MLGVLIGFVQLVAGVIAAYSFLLATVFLEATLPAPTLASAVALASIIWLVGLLASVLFGVARPALFGLVFTFIGTAAFTSDPHSAYELRYQDAGGGDLFVQGDSNRDGVGDFSFFVHAPSLTGTDFIL